MRFTFIGVVLIAVLSLCQAHAAPNDPYNSYLWNRDNVNAQNGEVDRGDWFEWWYYKVVNPQTGEAFYFTYGVVNPWDADKSLGGTKAVIQAGDFKNRVLVSSDFRVTDFSASYDKTWVKLGDNTATDAHLQGHVIDGNHDVSWDLTVEPKWSFAAMGWSMSVPNLSGIYWYPAQASAAMSGWIKFDGRLTNLHEAPGYQDRNWGRSFPKWWTWLTSNTFKDSPGTTLAAGGGEPKVFNSVYLFSGLCIGLNYQGTDYIFRTVDGDSVDFDIRWGTWSVVAQNGNGEKIEISAYAPPEQFLTLPFQSPRGPIFYDYEALLGKMTVKLFTRPSIFADWKPLATLETDTAGIEWGTPDPINSFTGLFTTTNHLQ